MKDYHFLVVLQCTSTELNRWNIPTFLNVDRCTMGFHHISALTAVTLLEYFRLSDILCIADKSKYPIGSGRITFNNLESHMKAIRAGTVEIRTAKFTRQIKIDPYLEDSVCGLCGTEAGPYFCRDLQCFSYFCYGCWQHQHSHIMTSKPHLAMVRPARNPVEDTF